MKTLTALITALILGIMPVSVAAACMCAPADDKEEQERVLKQFDLITVIEVLDVAISEDPSKPDTYRVRTLEKIKGNAPAEFEVRDTKNVSCGNYFNPGSVATVGIERHTSNKFTLYNECAQILLDAYMVGHRNMDNGGEVVTPLK